MSVTVFGLAVLAALLASLPWIVSDYGLGFMINLMCYVVLTVAWALFSGTTRYVSLATSAFFGIGAYTVAILVKVMSIYAIFTVAVVVGTVSHSSSGSSPCAYPGCSSSSSASDCPR